MKIAERAENQEEEREVDEQKAVLSYANHTKQVESRFIKQQTTKQAVENV